MTIPCAALKRAWSIRGYGFGSHPGRGRIGPIDQVHALSRQKAGTGPGPTGLWPLFVAAAVIAPLASNT